jgi:2-polyprenyl-3-methyl-5-hydroxy-6-metoxy-1,4-benzoquinol methylase
LKRFFRTFTWRGAQDAFEAWVRRNYVGLPDTTPPPAPVLPRITVVTPAMNAAGTIAETIESVLRQGYPNLEYIIVDGGSTDGTTDVIDRYKDRITKVIAGPDRGMYDAVSKGFEASGGEILGYLNADDLLEPGALRRIADHFRTNPNHAVIYHEDIVQMDGWRFPNAAQPRVNTIKLLNGHTLFQDGVWFRRDAYFWCGGMNRDLKVAGDYDLWLRMSRMFPMNRVDGHVSCFRVRAGQLSQDVDRYRAEQEVARRAFLSNFGLPGHVRCRLLWAKDLALGLAGRVTRGPRRLFFPIDFKGLPPPPGEPPRIPVDGSDCPLTGRTADRLLFSARDTRFADNRINYLYYCSASGVAVTYPPVGREALNELYEKYYSDPHPKVIHPDQRYGSPYRQWKGTKRAARIWTYVRVVGRLLDRGKSDPRLDDQTMREVFNVLRGIVPRRGRKAKFLDVGCFDGRLLGAIKRATDWEAYGLEANGLGVRKAREAGHRVWQAYAEDAPVVVPDGILFDVIFLGQTIEHLANPLETIRRLRQMLAPGGVLLVSTPNLDSAQIDRFGPTWAHWHLPYHRAIYSRRGLARAAELAGMRVLKMRTFSHPRWTFMSLILNELGLGSSVPHGLEVPDDWRRRSLALWTWSRLFWDWRGRGDYVYAAMENV